MDFNSLPISKYHLRMNAKDKRILYQEFLEKNTAIISGDTFITKKYYMIKLITFTRVLNKNVSI